MKTLRLIFSIFSKRKKRILPEYKTDILATIQFINHFERGDHGLGKDEAFEKFNFIDKLIFQTDFPSERAYLRALRFYLVQILVSTYRYDRHHLEILTYRRKHYPLSHPLNPDYEDDKK